MARQGHSRHVLEAVCRDCAEATPRRPARQTLCESEQGLPLSVARAWPVGRVALHRQHNVASALPLRVQSRLLSVEPLNQLLAVTILRFGFQTHFSNDAGTLDVLRVQV